MSLCNEFTRELVVNEKKATDIINANVQRPKFLKHLVVYIQEHSCCM